MTHKAAFRVLVLIMAMIAVLTVFYATRFGASVGNDSAGYLCVARDFSSGRGLCMLSPDGVLRPLTVWPPIYPMALSLAGRMAGDEWTGARRLNAVLMGINVLLVMMLIRARLPGSIGAPVAGACLFMSYQIVLMIHSSVLSEPLFLAFVLAGIWSLCVYVHTQRWWRLGLAAALLTGGMLTRYAGAPLLAVGGLTALLATRGGFWRRIGAGAFFTAAASLFLVPWFLRGWLMAGNVADRSAIFHPLTMADLSDLFYHTSRWVLPGVVPAPVRILALGCAFGIFLLLAGAILQELLRTRGEALYQRPMAALSPVLLVMMGAYFSFIVVAATFMDDLLMLEGRILMPLFVFGLIFLCGEAGETLVRARLRPAWRVAATVAVALFVAMNLLRGGSMVAAYTEDSLGYAAPRFSRSPVIAALAALPPEVPVYTNMQEGVYFVTGRPTRRLPMKRDLISSLVNDRLDEEIAAMRECLEREGGAIAYFDTRRNHWDQITLDETGLRARLRPVARGDGCGLYQLQGSRALRAGTP